MYINITEFFICNTEEQYKDDFKKNYYNVFLWWRFNGVCRPF